MKMLNEFWEFMRERELIRLRRRAGLPREQWTTHDPFRHYSFTNVKREHDRMSVFVKKIYDRFYGSMSPEDKSDDQNRADLLMNCAVARYFCTEQSVEAIGYFSWADMSEHHSSWPSFVERIRVLGSQGDLTFTGSYIVPNCGDTRAKYEIVADILDGIYGKRDTVVSAMDRSWQEATKILTSCWGCGSFMAKEVLLDYVMATGLTPPDWQTWTPVGPGGCRGAGWVLTGWKEKLSEANALDVIRGIYATRDEHWPTKMFITETTDGIVHSWSETIVSLDLTDIQFQLCEFDKYNRVKNGMKPPRRKFRPTIDEVTRGE